VQEEKCQLSNDDKVVILSIFNQDIQKGELLTTEEVKAICRNDSHLKTLLLDPSKIKKACDFLRYKANIVRQTQLTQDSDDENDFDPLTHSSALGLRRTSDLYSAAVIEDQLEQ